MAGKKTSGEEGLAKGTPNLSGAQYAPCPPNDWRAPVSAAYDSDADSALTAALVASPKTWPPIQILPGASRTIALKIDSIAAPGGLFYYTFHGNVFTRADLAVEVSISTDSIDGTDGSWTVPPTPTSYGPRNAPDNGRAIALPAGFAGWVRMVAASRDSGTQVARVGAFQVPATARADIWVLLGASFEEYGHQPVDMIDAVRRVFPDADPMIFDYGAGGATTEEIEVQAKEAIASCPIANYWLYNPGGNTVTGIRPYKANSAEQRKRFRRAVRTTINLLRATGGTVFCPRISYRNYPSMPPVDGVKAQANGSKPYNDNLLDPIIGKLLPDCFDPEFRISRIDEYSPMLHHRDLLAADGTHAETDAGYSVMRDNKVDTCFRRIYTGSWPEPYACRLVATAEGSPSDDTIGAAREVIDALPPSAGKKALRARLRAVSALP